MEIADSSTSSSNEFVTSKADAHTLALHPLVIINISDHYTRQKVQTKLANPRVIGALLGQQRAKSVELFNSFELIYDVVDGNIVVNVDFFRERKSQFKQNFEKLDVIGWYSTGSSVTATDINIQRQLLAETDGEVSTFLLLDAVAAQSMTRDLPIQIFESELKMNNDGSTSMMFSRLPFKVDTGDAERVAVDHVAQARPVGENESPTVAYLVRVQNAIRMLHERITVVQNYLRQVQSGEITEIDYSLLRQINGLCAMLPAMDTLEFKEEALTEYNDSLLQTYLATVTKGSNTINNLVDHYNQAFDRHSRMRFIGMR